MIALMWSALALAQEAPPIVNGEETDAFPEVGALLSMTNSGAGYQFCSGTLVHERWVITAGHCVDAFEDNERYGYSNHYFVLGTDVYSSSGVWDYAEIVAYHPHPSYNRSNLDYDIGILELGQAITSTDPMPVNDDEPHQSWGDVTYVGWGITGDRRSDSGIKRTVEIPIYTVDNNHIYTYDADHNVCSGDSGGAALGIEEGLYELIGANSFIFNINGGQPTCDGSGGAGASTRVDNSLDWLEGYVDLYRVEDFDESPGEDEPGDGGGTGGTDGGGTGGTDGGGEDTGVDPDGGTDGGQGGQGGQGGWGKDASPYEDPVRPSEVGLAIAAGCSAAPGGTGGLGLLALAGLALIRRRRR